MGKGTNQIATWSDLYSIGYRVPTSYRSSKECITYQNLEDLATSTDILSNTQNAQLPNSYYNGNSVGGFTITAYNDVPTSGDYKETIVQTSDSSIIYSNIIGVFNSNLNGVTSACLSPFNLTLYVYCIRNAGYMPEGSLYYRVAVRSGSTTGPIITCSEWDRLQLRDEHTGVGVGINIPKSSEITTLGTYYLVVEWFTTMTTNYYYGAKIGFQRSAFSVYPCYTSYMCVPWNRIKGYNGQTLSESDPVKVPVKCYIEEAVSGSIEAQTFEFRYEYQLSGSSTWNSITTGTLKLQTSSGQLQGSAQGTCYVLINPKVSGTVVADRLAVFCGTLSSGKYWRWKQEYSNNPPASWSIPSSDAKYTSFRIYMGTPTTKNYNSDLRNLTGFYYRILDSI